MFQSLRPNNQIFILHKDKSLLEVGSVVSVSMPTPKYPVPQVFGQPQEMVVDIVAKVNNQDVTYQKLPANLDIADFGTNGISIQRDVVLDFNGNDLIAGGKTTKNSSISINGEYDATVKNVDITGGSLMFYYGANVVLDGVNLTYNFDQSGRNLVYVASDNDKQAVVTIKNGNYTLTGGSGNRYLCAHGNAIINVEGGNFSGKAQSSSYAAIEAIAIGSYVPQIIITGGTFDHDPSLFVPATHEAVKSGSIWTVSAKQ